MGIRWKNRVKKIVLQGALAGVLQAEGQEERPLSGSGMESLTEGEVPEGQGGTMLCGDFTDEKPMDS